MMTPPATATKKPDRFSGAIKHDRIRSVMDELLSVTYPESQSLIVLCGPTGVGKSTLAHFIVKSMCAEAMVDGETSTRLPAVYVEAPSSGEKEFSWRMFYSEILAAMEPELALPKKAYLVDPYSGRLMAEKGAGGKLASLRKAVETCMQHRSTDLLVVDEAVHIINQTLNTKLLTIQLNTIKSLANRTRAQIMLMGSYDLLDLMLLSGQLARRTHVLHFERYRPDTIDDTRAFGRCLRQFQGARTDIWGDGLMKHVDTLMENSVGCIGILSETLGRAVRIAEREGWSESVLERALVKPTQHKTILEEVLEGEERIRNWSLK